MARNFVDSWEKTYKAGDLRTIGGLYTDESVFMVDGAISRGLAAIGATFTPRFAAGSVDVKHSSIDGQFTPSGHLMCLVTGMSKVPEGNFTSAFAIFPAAGGGLSIRGEMLRFGPGVKPMNTELDPSGTGEGFAKMYYGAYSTDRSKLGPYYREGSNVSFEGRGATGLAGIGAALMAAPKGEHVISTLDVATIGAELMVMVTGLIRLDGEEHPLPFSHLFELAVDASGPFIANEIFRFVIA